MSRIVPALLAALMVSLPLSASAQDAPGYKEKREQLAKELEAAQKALASTRGQRVQLESRVESAIAQMMQERAQSLMLGTEQTALQQLDAILTTSQDNLIAQRDRFAALGSAVATRTGAVLVVLLRADSSQAQTVASANVSVDNTPAETRSYTETANKALQMGAVDQLYRAPVLPTAHAVTISVVVNGQTLTQTVNVTAAAESATYVQFAVRNGQLTQTTWTSRGTTPF